MTELFAEGLNVAPSFSPASFFLLCDGLLAAPGLTPALPAGTKGT